MSAAFRVSVPNSPGGRPVRTDSGAVVDMNYWINRVLGPGGTGGSLNVAVANAAMYCIGFDFGLSEVENGTTGPFTNFADSNVQLLNQSNAMAEAGFTEGTTIDGVSLAQTISDRQMAFFPNFPMMQDGTDFQPLLRPGVLNNPPVLVSQQFPFDTHNPTFFVPADSTINEDPGVTVNTYLQLVNDSDIGANPDVAYVTGTGAFDQIFITKISKTQAKVTVDAYTDKTYSQLITSTADGTPLIGSYTYNINLSKLVIPGRKDDGKPFEILVEGTTNDDRIFLDPTLGVNVVVDGGGYNSATGGASVKMLNITGNGTYTAQYTPNAPAAALGGLGAGGTPGIVTEVAALIPEGLVSAQAGTLKIAGTTASTTTTVKNGKKTITTTLTPFTTTMFVNYFDPNTASAVSLDNFASLTYSSPGYLNNQFTVTTPTPGVWSLGGEVDSPTFGPALNGAVNFTNVKTLTIDTSKGSSNDNISFSVGDAVNGGGEALATGLQSVIINTGAGIDQLSFDDSASIADQPYTITPTLMLPTQNAISPFLGYSYSGVESLDIVGTQGKNNFFVSPSSTTSINIDGQDPPTGSPDGDTLTVRLASTLNPSEFDDGAGTGVFSFDPTQKPAAFKPINFTNIENLPQVSSPGVLRRTIRSSSNRAMALPVSRSSKCSIRRSSTTRAPSNSSTNSTPTSKPIAAACMSPWPT